MKSPLEIDKDTVKEFAIKPEHDLNTGQKLIFLNAQKNEMQTVLWRNRMDLIIAMNQVEDLNKQGKEELAGEHAKNVLTYRSTIKQLVLSVTIINKLIKEVESTDGEASGNTPE